MGIGRLTRASSVSGSTRKVYGGNRWPLPILETKNYMLIIMLDELIKFNIHTWVRGYFARSKRRGRAVIY